MARPTPHVVLITGVHLKEFTSQVDEVIQRERPAAFYTEFLATPEQRKWKYGDLARNAHQLVNSDHPAKAFIASMYLLARKHSIPFDFAERHTDRSAAESRKLLASSDQTAQFSKSLLDGDVDGVIRSVQNEWSAFRQLGAIREPLIAKTLSAEAKSKGKICAFVGGVHAGLIKQLQQKGINVILYDVPRRSLVSNVVLGPQLRSLHREQALRIAFAKIINNYLQDRYGISTAQTYTLGAALKLSELFRVPPREVESFIKNSAGLTPLKSRVHLLSFLTSKGIAFPSKEGMEVQLRENEPLPARKVKVFEPRK